MGGLICLELLKNAFGQPRQELSVDQLQLPGFTDGLGAALDAQLSINAVDVPLDRS